MRRIALGAVAVLLLAGGAIAAIVLLTGGGPAGGIGPEPLAAVVDSQAGTDSGQAPAPATPPPAPPPDLSRYARQTGTLPPPMEYQPTPPPPPPGSWEAARPTLPSRMGAIGGALHAGLQELEPRLSACFDEVTQARYAQAMAPGTAPEAEPDPDAPPPSGAVPALLLHVETLDGRIRIADAVVESRGGASDGLVACTQRVLRGQTFPAPGAKPGQRFRVPHRIAP